MADTGSHEGPIREAVLDDIAVEQLDSDEQDEIHTTTIAELRGYLARPSVSGRGLPDLDYGNLLAALWLWKLIPAESTLTEADATATLLIASSLAEANPYTYAVALLADDRWLFFLRADHPRHPAEPWHPRLQLGHDLVEWMRQSISFSHSWQFRSGPVSSSGLEELEDLGF